MITNKKNLIGGTVVALGLMLAQTGLPFLRAQAFYTLKTQETQEIAVNLGLDVDDATLKTLERVIYLLPSKYTNQIQEININYDKYGVRGQSNGPEVRLDLAQIESQSEFAGVALHEFCHSIDFVGLVGYSRVMSDFPPDMIDDPSLDFYKLNWKDLKTPQPLRSAKDFITGYARTSPAENFAETCISYVFYADQFLDLTTRSEILRQQYDFMKDRVFDGITYESAEGEFDVNNVQSYDSTLVSRDFARFYERNQALPQDRAVPAPSMRLARTQTDESV